MKRLEEYRSRVYTDRPDYADFDAPEKFQAIMGIIMTRLREHPKAICSYSGGADSDILIDLIETARKIQKMDPVLRQAVGNVWAKLAVSVGRGSGDQKLICILPR